MSSESIISSRCVVCKKSIYVADDPSRTTCKKHEVYVTPAQCEYREWLEGDEIFGSGEQCKNSASWISCDYPRQVCTLHKCRCAGRMLV